MNNRRNEPDRPEHGAGGVAPAWRQTAGGLLGLAIAALAACSGDPSSEANTAVDEAGDASRARLAAGPAEPSVARTNETVPSAQAPGADLDGAARGALQLVLRPSGDIPLLQGGVERSFRLQLRNDSGATLPPATLELVQVPPGVDVVRGRITTAALAPQASASPRDILVLRLRDAGVLDLSTLGWRWVPAPVQARAQRVHERLLNGDASAPAVSVLDDLAALQSGDNGPRLHALLAPGATVGAVNAALRGAQVRIDEMRPGNHTLVLAAQWPGERAALDAASRLDAAGVFERVLVSAATQRSAAGALLERAVAAPASGAQGSGAADDSCSD